MKRRLLISGLRKLLPMLLLMSQPESWELLVDSQSKKIKAQSEQIELLSKKNEAQSKQIESLSKNNEIQGKQIESQSVQLNDMEEKMKLFMGELQLFKTAFPDIYSKSDTLSGASNGD